jgi:hypothetical protein
MMDSLWMAEQKQIEMPPAAKKPLSARATRLFPSNTWKRERSAIITQTQVMRHSLVITEARAIYFSLRTRLQEVFRFNA